MNRKNILTILAWMFILYPAVLMGLKIFSQDLGANPVEKLEHISGDWTINFLLLSLSITPLIKLFSIKEIFFLRKFFGLTAFFYAFFHFGVYMLFDSSLELNLLVKDVIKRPYITAGFMAFLIISVMALTSQRKHLQVAKRSWKKIHRLVYLAAVFSVLHYIWLVKADHFQPLIYGTIAGFLLAERLIIYLSKKKVESEGKDKELN